MPTIAEQRESALAQLRLHAQPDVAPALSADDLEAILDNAQRATVWANATAYDYDAVILPTVRNGHTYRCIVAGTSEALLADEPEWPTGAQATITEGASDPLLTWQEAGSDYGNVFNLRAAIHEAWMVKASKASLSVDISQDVGGVRASQIYDHCIKQAEKFSPVGMG